MQLQWISVPISDRWFEYAQEHAEDIGENIKFNQNEKKNVTAKLGEMAFAKVLADHEIPFKYDAARALGHDFRVPGMTIDTKTQRLGRASKPWYNLPANVNHRQWNNVCDEYVFMTLVWPLDGPPVECQVISSYPKHLYHDHPEARVFEAGEYSGKLKVHERCRCLGYKHMPFIEVLLWHIGRGGTVT